MKKPLVVALAAAATVLAAGAAHAGSNVYWSIGLNAPGVGTVISNAPGYYDPAPVYAYPPQVVYAPTPRVYYPPQVEYAPSPRVYYPPQVVYERPAPIYYQGARRIRDRDRDGIPNRYDRYDNRAGRHGAYGDRDRDGIPNRYDRNDGRDGRRYGY
ncbi:MAG: hypothetical protein ABIX46_11775 [Burkholderiaceae bacterium]